MLRRTLWRAAAVLAVVVVVGLFAEDHRSCKRQEPVRSAFRDAVVNLDREAAYLERRGDVGQAELLRQRAQQMRVPAIDCSQFPPGH